MSVNNITFVKSANLSDSYRLQVKRLWLQSFPLDLDLLKAGEIETKMGMLPETIIVLLPTAGKRKIIGMSFLFLPNQYDLEEKQGQENKYYQSLREQGVQGEEDVYLYNLCIREQDRRKGYSFALMLAIENEMKTIGKKRIILFVDEWNKPAVSLYNKLKYKVIQSTPKGFLMEKRL